MAGQPVKPAETLAERFWSVAREMEAEAGAGDPDPVAVVRHVLRVLDSLEAGQVGRGVTSNTLDFLVMLRQYQIMGDLTYASPEQARGEEVDDRSLVFSVGVLLFEKLTGRHPFGAEAAGRRLARMQKGELGSGVAYFPKLPERLRQVLMRAMGPFPEDRWGTLKELRGELERFVDEATRRSSLPGVAGGATGLDNAPTRVVNMTALEKMARLSAERGVAEMDTPMPDTAAATPSLRPGASRYAPIGWIALGAGLASLVFILIGERGGPAELTQGSAAAPATASARKGAVPVPAPLPPVVTPAGVGAAATTGAAAAPGPSPSPARPPSPSSTPSTSATRSAPASGTDGGRFDAELGGRRGLDNARACFATGRVQAGVLFGAGLLYGADGVSRKVYFGSNERLSPDERRCVTRSLLGVSGGGPLGKNQIVEYTYRYRPTGADVRIRGR